ncbi:conserved hypothetical protein [Talaromyces stipitatus ATCC 10500]|uniref:GPI anchored protein n=1 Tax=Talaromyces stipitatus (strain ATCC 10500 / CBS 375.48 / QM 6759 / NRRL 1006) TaxID=441959 RepID=B8M575_TALSN|nr:uncharacterized protein TSTA_029560 [Talaromyces stipitatus ATCC 10500]EED19681.1 conserved hypothetical protein [Talaromyces stipitatus ATCC 10500]
MRPTVFSFYFLLSAVFASAAIEKRDSASPTITSDSSYATISAILGSLASAVSSATPAAGVTPVPAQTANLSNIAEPPAGFIPAIMTAIPLSVLGDLIDSSSRSSLASEFRNGSTPAWYQSLPASIKSYISVVNSQINAGALSANTSAPVVATSTSTAMAMHRVVVPTEVAMGANLLGVLGVAGLAMAL